ncbi:MULTISPECIES: ChrR family anti-sigma-E factor [Rhodanobacter]|uniref:ChrR family anti-sigma-E factor n=1 Tax=Rhodanobacter TaxID=75309 RepID=UPI000423904B|nr:MULTISPECIES: ChrR family anti-sigma-E factor [Rhodanobacter]KZC21408.1 transcriptional regulator [Rhodanobacter denitrificans]UJJ51297.1 ChrR family anti-sigma-E factor [Rhodanobacter denitrificans]UJM94044.1 ChrR family anti-sigma-E factor [Rhodanobacter denitrificans]UJM97573.1 ChrR family anti-sigma-E factor [Rhodanobacter denitrificans]UJN23011.1 ChrR family anti-sigma-E factor [Rhodanobacter denitrificans]
MKPHHHLDDTTLLSYSAGALPSALAVVASAHLERCAQCRESLHAADRIGGVLMQQQRVDAPTDDARVAMLARLDDEPPVEPVPPPFDLVEEADHDRLPGALQPWFGHSLRALRWKRVAPGVQRIRASGIGGGNLMLLRIAPGSKLPLHSHGGSELTMILDGAYDDMLGHFGPGDVADLDGQINHQPVTSPGVPCICVAATDAPLVFSGWFARTLQPLLGF